MFHSKTSFSAGKPCNKVYPSTLWVVLMAALTACGGGGGGGGSSTVGGGPGLEITLPPSQISQSEQRDSGQLNVVSAASVLSGDETGNGVDVAIVDSGVMASHSEFDNRVQGGGDWQGTGDGTSDPNGHGTHVASLLIASGDGKGMVGIAPRATAHSYRILNHSGSFGSRSGNVMVPAVLNSVTANGLPVVNNSWSSIYEIDDLGRDTIAQALAGELSAYQNLATADGPIMVWAAGNHGEAEVSVRSGLPFHFPELQSNWLTVVATDLDGRETQYTNRCGVSADWCLTAPGGGDNEAIEGLIGASIGGGYTRKSGTSMAAPLVSGALAVLISRFPNLTPREAAQRLIATAELEGLITTSGCTVATCGEAHMREVFGHGMINLNAALSPISPSSLVSGRGDNALDTSFLFSPSIVGDAMKDGLGGAIAVVRDDFDGTYFTVPVSVFSAHSPRRSALLRMDTPVISGQMTHAQPTGFRFARSQSNPAEYTMPARLVDIPASPTKTWAGYGVNVGHHWARFGFGNGDKRQTLHLMVAEKKQSAHWFGLGVDTSRQWLDGHGEGAFGIHTSRSVWGFGGAQWPLLETYLTMEGLMGRTHAQGDGLIEQAEFQFNSGQLRLSSHRIPEKGWAMTLSLPPAINQGWVDLRHPQLDGYGKLDFTTRRHDIDLDEREIRVSLDLSGDLADLLQYQFQLHHSHHAGNIVGIETTEAVFKLTLPF